MMITEEVSETGQEEIDMTPLEIAEAHDHRARELDKVLSSSWQEIGLLAITVRDKNEWQLLKYHSFNAWLVSACPKSRSIVYAAIGALEELKDFTPEELQDIKHSTAHVLKKLPRAVRAKPEIRKAARELTTKEFTRKIKKESPELHIEQFVSREFRFEESQEDVIDKAIAKKKKEDGNDKFTDEIALEAICADYLLEEV